MKQKMMQGKLSVLIPVYNTASYLPKCLDSILDQTYRNIEVVVVNDGSTDQTASILDHYATRDARVNVIHKENGGHQSARRAAIEASTGDFITFVDSDDSLPSLEVFEVMLNAMTDSIAMTVGRISIDNGKTLKLFPSDVFITIPSDQYLKKILSGRVGWNLYAKLFRSHLLKSINSTPIEVTTGEDAMFVISLLDGVDQSIAMVDIPVYNYFVRPGSITNSINSRYIADNLKVANYIEEMLKDKVDQKYLVAFSLLCLSNSFRYGWLGADHHIYTKIFAQYRANKGATQLFHRSKRVKIYLLLHFGDLLSKYIFKNRISNATI